MPCVTTEMETGKGAQPPSCLFGVRDRSLEIAGMREEGKERLPSADGRMSDRVNLLGAMLGIFENLSLISVLTRTDEMGGIISLFWRRNLMFGKARVREGPVSSDPVTELGFEALLGQWRAAEWWERSALWVLLGTPDSVAHGQKLDNRLALDI